jgi:uncharacterized membrane protein YfcA
LVAKAFKVRQASEVEEHLVNAVGFTLGLVGGGGSIFAVPLMVYLVGVRNPHIAIGTSALSVAANAAIGTINHARSGTVKWRCALMYAGAGIVGAVVGSTAGKAFNGQKLLFLFAVVMVVVGVLMLRDRRAIGDDGAECIRENAPRVLGFGLGTGVFSGFFGVGGGFLIVPGLVASTGMPIINAIAYALLKVETSELRKCDDLGMGSYFTKYAAHYQSNLDAE